MADLAEARARGRKGGRSCKLTAELRRRAEAMLRESAKEGPEGSGAAIFALTQATARDLRQKRAIA